jgi:subtilisin family serine protease
MSAQGFVFVAAAGNDGPAADPAYPAAYPQVIAVTAVGKDMRNYPYANRGPHIDVAAPGVGVWTAVPGSREGYRSGTSFAAPFATAVLSLVSQDRPITRKETLLEEAKISPLSPRGGDPIYGRGLLQAPQTCFPGTGRIADRAPQTEVAPR